MSWKCRLTAGMQSDAQERTGKIGSLPTFARHSTCTLARGRMAGIEHDALRMA
jgi:hypothetical protein